MKSSISKTMVRTFRMKRVFRNGSMHRAMIYTWPKFKMTIYIRSDDQKTGLDVRVPKQWKTVGKTKPKERSLCVDHKYVRELPKGKAWSCPVCEDSEEEKEVIEVIELD